MEKPIYEIYVYEKPWYLDEKGFLMHGSYERVGYYYELETALKAVKENWCDLQDHYAHAAMIQEVTPGLYPHPPRSKCHYFIWNSQKECFEEAEVPEVDWWPN